MDKIKLMLSILDETIQYYSEDTTRRSVSGHECRYRGSDGKRCAFSRCVKDEMIMELQEGYNCNSFAESTGSLDHLVKEEYTGLEVAFWSRLQGLHDRPEFWNEAGLTDKGESYAQQLREHISSGESIVDYYPKLCP